MSIERIIQITDSFHDNRILPKKRFVYENWDHVIDLFSEHTITEDKDCKMYSFISFNMSKDAEYIPLTDANRQFWEPNIVRRCSHNVESISALVLDYDSGITMNEVQRLLEDFEYILYTSHSHLKDGKTEKFRVIIPLDTPVAPNELKSRKKSMIGFFKGIDISTFSISRSFYIPSTCKDREHLAEIRINHGIALSLNMFRKIKIKKPKPISLDEIKSRPLKGLFGGTKHAYRDMFDIVAFYKDKGYYKQYLGINESDGSHRHLVKCPREEEHTAPGGTVIYARPYGEVSTFLCAHSHDIGQKEFWDWVKGYPDWETYCEMTDEKIFNLSEVFDDSQ